MERYRESGIDKIGQIPWGAHLSYLYTSKDDFARIVAPFINSGLSNNELCIWIYPKNQSLKEAKSILETCVKNPDTYIKKKQLKLLPYTRWYVQDKNFNEMRVNRQWMELIKYAEENGFDGLRAVGDTSWLKKCHLKEFERYEHNIKNFFSGYNFLALCLYDIKKTTIHEVVNILQTHSFTVIADNPELNTVRNIELMAMEKEYVENKKTLNKMLEYDKMKTEFISNISHELKTPLNIILSALQLLDQISSKSDPGKVDAAYERKMKKYMKIMKQNCYRQLRLVNNLIDLSKIEANFLELHFKNCNIVKLIEDITLSISDYINNKGIKLIFDTDCEELITACDPDRFENIILNLLSNAVKFTNTGGTIQVAIRNRNETVAIHVKDSGIGIPKDKLESIFERFRQVDMTLTRNYEGSGIGLSLVKSLVEKHGGNIRVNSEVGKGSEFIVELPCRTVPVTDSDVFSQDNLLQKRIEKINIEFSDLYF